MMSLADKDTLSSRLPAKPPTDSAPTLTTLTAENRQMLYRQKLQRVLNNLPPFSPILNRLIASLASEDVRFSDLSVLIEKDTVLSGHVLRLVNSAAMARRSRITSISHAVSVLGLIRLRNFLLSLSIARLWQSTKTPLPWNMAHFNLHAAAVALMSDLLVQNCNCRYAEGAFIAGLLHDYGKMLITAAIPEQFLEIVNMVKGGHGSIMECEMQVTGFTHPELSAMTLKAWNLPEEIIRGVEFHHQPELEEQMNAAPGEGILLSRIIYTADIAVRHLGIHVLPLDGPEELSRPNALATIEKLVSRENAAKILESFDSEYDAIRSFF